jgi:hypothetical protein
MITTTEVTVVEIGALKRRSLKMKLYTAGACYLHGVRTILDPAHCIQMVADGVVQAQVAGNQWLSSHLGQRQVSCIVGRL